MIRYALIFSNRVPGCEAGIHHARIHKHILIHTITPKGILSSPACFGEVRGNQRTQKKPLETQGECKQVTRAQDRTRDYKGVKWQHYTHCSTIHEAVFCILYLFSFIICTLFYISRTYLLNINFMTPDSHAAQKTNELLSLKD